MSKKQNQTQKSTLTFAKVKKDAKRYNESILWEFSDGETLKVYPYFRPSTINKLLEELQRVLVFAYKEKEEIKDDEMISEEYINQLVVFLCIKHFTAAKSMIKDDPETLLEQQKEFMKSRYFNEIIEDVFLPSEIKKVEDQLLKFVATSQLLVDYDTRLQDKLGELRVRYEDVFKDLDNIKPKQIPEM